MRCEHKVQAIAQAPLVCGQRTSASLAKHLRAAVCTTPMARLMVAGIILAKCDAEYSAYIKLLMRC